MKYITLISNKIREGLEEKGEFLPILEKAEEEILTFSHEMDFTYEEPANIFPQSTDDRLNDIVKKQQKALLNPEITIQECIKKELSTLRNFVEKYHIGFVSQARVFETGCVEVDIPCSIHSSFLNDNRASAQATFDAQIRFLKDLGLRLSESEHFGIRILRDENNMSLLEKIFKEKGCSRIQFSTSDDYIDAIKCNINITDLKNFNEEPIHIEIGVSDVLLNKDEKEKVLKYVREILEAKSSIAIVGNKMKNTCCSLIEHYFAKICEVFDYDGQVVQRVKERFQDERDKNIEIANIESSIGNSIDPKDIRDIITKAKNTLNQFTIERLSFRASDFAIDKYGIATAKLHFVNRNWFGDCCLASEEYLRDNFKMSQGEQEEETLGMLDTYKNKLKIAKMLSDFCPTTRIINIQSNVKNGEFCINNIDIAIDNISKLLEK